MALDLAGGWNEAGGTLKQTFPFATSVWRLAWTMTTYRDAYVGTRHENATNYENALRQLLWASDYLFKIHPNAEQRVLVAQV